MKNIGFKILYVVTLLVTVIELGFILKDNLFTDISKLPTGTLVQKSASPNNERMMNVYVVNNSIGKGVRIEIADENEAYNIFWQTGIDEVVAEWTNDDTVLINNVPLDANNKDGYDSRRGHSLFDEGALEDNFANFEEQNEEE